MSMRSNLHLCYIFGVRIFKAMIILKKKIYNYKLWTCKTLSNKFQIFHLMKLTLFFILLSQKRIPFTKSMDLIFNDIKIIILLNKVAACSFKQQQFLNLTRCFYFLSTYTNLMLTFLHMLYMYWCNISDKIMSIFSSTPLSNHDISL